ncbi:MAG: NUDIX domain-containing protein [Haloarculaceae archaeon]
MDETHVVTVFLRHQSDVLLLRRSDQVGSYAGTWGAVAGHAEGDPDAAAREEIREETGLDPGIDVTPVRSGGSFPVADDDLGVRWIVHPYLFEANHRDVEPNRETETWEWVQPTVILRRETVPDLWRSYDAVRPTVDSVATDREHGSAWLSLRALEVLRDEAALAVEGPANRRDGPDGVTVDLLARARDLVAARPSMPVVRNRIDRAMARALGADEGAPDSGSEGSPILAEAAAGGGSGTSAELAAAVEAAADAVLARSHEVDGDAAAAAAERVGGARVATLSRSGTVLDAFREGAPEAVLVAESRPGREGVTVAEALAAEGLDVTLTGDAALAAELAAWDADLLLVGADAVLADGHVVNKVGTRGAAIVARRVGVPVLVAAATDKVDPRGTTPAEVDREAGAMGPLYDGEALLSTANPTFDVTPPDLVEAVLAEDGSLSPAEVAAVADEHRARAAWRTSE